jgi:hypothetical protein
MVNLLGYTVDVSEVAIFTLFLLGGGYVIFLTTYTALGEIVTVENPMQVSIVLSVVQMIVVIWWLFV